MHRFYLYAFFSFAAWITLSLTLHYFSASPWGGPLVISPDRMLPDALFIEIGLLLGICILACIPDRFLPERFSRVVWRPLFILFLIGYCFFGQLDREAVRWLGQHLTLSFLANYMAAPTDALTLRIFSDDIFWTSIAFILVGLTAIPAYFTWSKGHEARTYVGNRTLIGGLLLCALLLTAHQWFRPSEKRWRRVRPATVSIAHDAYRTLLQLDRAKNPARALSDLQQIALGNTDLNILPDNEATAEAYPLWRDTNLGALDAEAFQALPLAERPNIIFIVYETWRGWNTGLVPDAAYDEGNPLLNPILRDQAIYFPYTHSVGFPSVEGLIGMHLGVWSHPHKILAADYLTTRTRSFPEILRDFGYATFARVGADPSFSNFTSWFNRWYEEYTFDSTVTHDGPLVEAFIQDYEDKRGDDPKLMLLWTATTHPPYRLPDTEDVIAADDIEGRYFQSLRYSDEHIAKLLHYLQEQPEWDRTIVIMVGDHSQPTPDQWRFLDAIGGLSAGHTWTSLAILGGWPGLPEPGRFDFDVTHADLPPTILSLLNIRTHNHFLGSDLRAPMEDMRSADPARQARAMSRLILSLRYGDIAWQRDNERFVFRLDSDDVFHSTFDRSNAVQYGQLALEALQISDAPPQDWPLERWQDVIRGYHTLLHEDRLMPAPSK